MTSKLLPVFGLVVLLLGLAGMAPEQASAGTAPLLQRVNTDKARYNPGEQAAIYLDLKNGTGSSFAGSVTLYFRHLGAEAGPDQTRTVSLGAGQATTLTYAWTPPSTDYRGYLVEAWVRDQSGAVVDSGSTAIDVSSNWTRFPRYGYVSEFADTVDTANSTWQLKNYHINALQFYDWHWQHHRPNPDPQSPSWQDIANRRVARSTVNGYISSAHHYGMKAMNYNLINGAFDNYWNDGVQVAWGLFKDSGGSYDPSRQDLHGLPGGWAGGGGKIYLFNPANPGWRNYIFTREEEVFQNFAFDGWHMDTLGPRGTLYDWNRNAVQLDSTYAGFINAAKARLQKEVVFNSVLAYGQDQVSADSSAEFVYTELWDDDESNDDYIDLLRLVERSKARSDKAVVFAAYMNYKHSQETPGGTQRLFNEASVRLADAAMFAAGASHIELGDGGSMLSNEYFPNKNLVMSDSLKAAMKNYYGFLTAYQNLLRDGVVSGSSRIELTGLPSSTEGDAGAVWKFSKSKDGYDIIHLINLENNVSTRWRDENAAYAAPDQFAAVPAKIYYEGTLRPNAKVWVASPDYDHGKAYSLSYSTGSDAGGSYVSLTVPKLHYWVMIWIEKGSNESGTALSETFEDASVESMPAGWQNVSGSWQVSQPAGATKELKAAAANSVVNYIRGFNTGDYSVEGHVYLPNTAHNAAVLARMQKSGGFYQLELRDGASWKLYKFDGRSTWTELASGAHVYSPGSYHYLKLTCRGNRLTVEVDLQQKATITDLNQPFLKGTVGLRAESADYRFDNIIVTGLAG
ncbi:glycoside hydrolase family 66 protein [Paenibacillus pasadenensis]|uniref:Dextranase n=1 Tax=Paenibacillus pasadenensis TaxID=217090 RepID=A0A2N5N218_9BACL|nr:glycoside hydrolase family 66 protein [Paenibacillus pasadenensis]PLT44378.1 dextranase precursor [Paenibacillus pasadenensis]